MYKLGRGRKPAYSPKPSEETESEDYKTIAQGPEQTNVHQTRWTPRIHGNIVPWLSDVSVLGIHQILTRLRISYKRGRANKRSSDTDYAKKQTGYSRFWKRLVNIHRPVLRFSKMSFRFTATPPWQRTGHTSTKTPVGVSREFGEYECY